MISAQRYRFFYQFIEEEDPRLLLGERVHREVRDLPARSRLMWQKANPEWKDQACIWASTTRFWIESADGLDLPPHDSRRLVVKALADSVRARIFGLTLDPAWDYEVIARAWTVIQREPGGVVGPDGILRPHDPTTSSYVSTASDDAID